MERERLSRMDQTTENIVFLGCLITTLVPMLLAPFIGFFFTKGPYIMLAGIIMTVLAFLVFGGKYRSKVCCILQWHWFVVRMILILPLVFICHGVFRTPTFYKVKAKSFARLQRCRAM